DNSLRINRGDGYDNQRLGNVTGARETKPKRAKDVAYHREKMLLCKQEEAGIQLNAEQADWKDDTDDESDDQELESYYMYMAKLQQVSPDAVDSGPIFDTEPEQKIQNDDHYDVFDIECQHPEQSESVHKTYLIEQDAHDVLIKSVDMNYDSEQIDQNDEDADLTKERELLDSLIEKLKCEIDESKNRNTLWETSNKVLVEKLKSEIKDFKNKNKSLTEANKKLSKENDLLYADFKKSKAKLKRRDSIEYASKMELACAKVRVNQDNSPRINRGDGYDNQRLGNVAGARETVEQADWRDDTDDESEDQELEAHYMYMAQVHEVNPDAATDSGPIFDSEPLQKIDQNDNDNDLANEHELLAYLIEKLKCEIDESKNHNKILETSNKVLVEKLKGEIEDFKNKNISLESSNNRFKEANSKLSETNKLLYNDFKKSQAELERRNDVEFASKILPPNKKSILKNTNVLAPGMYKLHKKPTQTRTSQLPNDSRKTNKRVSFSTGVIPTTSVNRPRLKSNPMEDRVMLNNSQGKKHEVEDHRRNVKFSKNKTSVTACNDSLNAKTLNVNFVCATCGKCVLNEKHDMCVLKSRNGVKSRTKMPIVVPVSTREPKRTVIQSVAKPLRKTVALESTNQKPRNTLRKPYERVKIVLFIVDSGCSKHMTGNLKLLINFVEKFLGTVKFGNDQIAPILGYKDLVQGAVTIKRVYYVEGLNHNLFSVGQFCDADLEVTFRKSICYIRDLKGNDLLTGSRGIDLYSITLQDTTSPNPICLMATVSSMVMASLSLSSELPHHQLAITPSSKRRLQLLHMDLCGPMRVASINGKRYVLVIVDDFSRYTWTHFLRSKDETPEVLIEFLRLVQRGLHAQVRIVRTDKGTKFLNQTLHAYFASEGILHQMSVARTLEQNGIVERRNRTLVEAARIMLSAAKVPLFFWAEAIATTCFTQNRSLVIPRHEKIPYHIINDRKPSVKFFNIFGSLCYIVRDGENLDK
nr:hypothetical protein [Tanacetum cinerariifolium]